MDFFEQPIYVYIKTDIEGNITEINSSLFIENTTGWLYLDSGYGDRFAHAQTQYLSKPIIDRTGKYNYKYINGNIVEN